MQYEKLSTKPVQKTFCARLTILFLAVCFLYSTQAKAQLDTSFGTNGVANTDVFNADLPFGLFVLPDQKILVVNRGQVWEFGQRKYYFLRYNANGTLDNTFGTNGIKELPIPQITRLDLLRAIRQPDGKIILAGTDNEDGFIARFNEDGSFDTSFGANGIHRPNIVMGSWDGIYDIVVQPDGKIVAAGNLPDSLNKIFLLRYLPNGTVDVNFGNGGFIIHTYSSTEVLYSVHIQSNGKIITAPTIGLDNVGRGYVRRFNSDGTEDNTFTPLNYSSVNVKKLSVLPNDKFLVLEEAFTTNSLRRNSRNLIVRRFNSNGTLDTTFGTGGSTTVDVTTNFNDYARGLTVQPDGQILIGGITEVELTRTSNRGSHFSIVRLSADGAVNGRILAFKTGIYGDVLFSFLPDGKILSLVKSFDVGSPSNIALAKIANVSNFEYRFKGNPFDFYSVNSDVAAELTTFRPSASRWFVYPSSSGFNFGQTGDIPVAADYVSNLITEAAVYRPANSTWYIMDDVYLMPTVYSVQWGITGDIPAPADFDGDSKADITVFRPSNGVWYIRNSNDESVRFFQWGLNGDKPVTGDYDGDGKYDIAVFRPSNNVWYISRSSDGGFTAVQWGLQEDIPVQEDYDGDGKTDIAVWRPSTRFWYILRSSDGGFTAVQWGLSTDYAVPADYDGDLKTDIAVFRPSINAWYILRSNDNNFSVITYGASGDVIPQRRQ